MNRKNLIIAVAIFAGGVLAGWLAAIFVADHLKPASGVEIHEGQYLYVNPLLECEDGGLISARELTSFRSSVEDLIEEQKDRGTVRSVAVYFRDLNNGPWFGIGERGPFSAASLLKVPILMAYLKHAEDDPSILGKKILASGDTDGMQNIRPSEVVKAGNVYTVEDLLYKMIVYSENNAARLLLAEDGSNYCQKIYADLGLPVPDVTKPDYSITVKAYASFFRVLFNASYLNRQWSNQALDLLSKAEFGGGLRAGVPSRVTVTHKFGERKIDDEIQFHDCGIVYYPDRPYLLCVMTRGENLADLVSAVQDISHLAFSEVDNQMRGGGR